MIIDGKAIAAKRIEDLGKKIDDLRVKPKLVAILVGSDSGSEMYVKMKAKRVGEVGIESEVIRFSEDTTDAELIARIKQLNSNPKVTGILVQLPLPGKLKEHTQEILDAIAALKDVDCLTTENLGLLKSGKARFLPATVMAILTILRESIGDRAEGIGLKGKTVTVIGQGKLVGKPLADYWESQGVRVNRCDEFTRDLSSVTRHSDILVCATGVPNLVTADMVKPGAVVIDCGSPKAEVDFENVSKVAGWITPVPGGVGPLTVISLLENTIRAAKSNAR